MVEVFRTSVNTDAKAEFLLEQLQREFPYYKINFDLEDCDNILRVETPAQPLNCKTFMALVESYGVIIEILPDEVPIMNKTRKKGRTSCLSG